MRIVKILLPVLFSLGLVQPVVSQNAFQLPAEARAELNRLDEAYTLLDQFAQEVWPGWNDYLNFPYLFGFQNGLRILVGHPNPPAGFFACPETTVHGLKVFADTASMNGFEVHLPLQAGGGVIPYGSYRDAPVTIVNISLTGVKPGTADGSPYISPEDHILVFIHELMHCYQETILKESYGNLSLNPDLNFAVYSEIEGAALHRAYLSATDEEARQYLRDFVIARRHKFDGISEMETLQARCDEFREGEAVYSEMVILSNLKQGFRSILDRSEDAAYTGFGHADGLLERYVRRLEESAPKTLELYQKNYDYGCFQALLLKRLFPGWQKEVEEGDWLDLIIAKRLGVTPADSLHAEARFHQVYNMPEIEHRHRAVIEGRDNCYRKFTSFRGRAYVIDCKQIKEPLGYKDEPGARVYKLGLMEMYPDGMEPIRFDSVEILPIHGAPVEVNQLYYLKMVNTGAVKPGRGYRIRYASKSAGGVYEGATLVTPVFTLKAPKIRIRESAGRIRVEVISRT